MTRICRRLSRTYIKRCNSSEEVGSEKLKKTLVTMATVTVVGLSSVFFTDHASAESIDDLKDKQTQIQDERETIKENLSGAETEIADLLIDLEKLNDEIDRVNKALDENKATMEKNGKSITETEEQVDKLEAEIKELEEAIEKRFDILKERAAAYQKNGGNISYLEVLFGSQNFMDFISRVSAINKITDSDAKLMEQIDADKVQVEEKQEEVITKLDELKEMRVELEGMEKTIKSQQAQNKDKKAKIKDKEAALVAKVDKLEVKDSELASLERNVRQNIKELTQPAPEVRVASNDTNVNNNSSNSNRSDNNSSNNNNSTSNSNNSSKSNLSTVSKEESKSSNTSDSSSSRPAASGGVQTAMNAGFAHLGTPYVWGGKGPGGFDCSGFVSWAFAQGGISVPSSTGGLAGVGTKVSASNMQPGDIVFFNTYKTNGHVGIYLGGGKFIGAQNSTGLAVADMSSGYWAGKFAGHVRSVR